MDLRTSNILTCPTCRKFFAPDVKQLIKNFTILGKCSFKRKSCGNWSQNQFGSHSKYIKLFLLWFVYCADYIYNKKEIDSFGGVCPSLHGSANVAKSGGQRQEEVDESFIDKFCLKHPQKKTKYFCEND